MPVKALYPKEESQLVGYTNFIGRKKKEKKSFYAIAPFRDINKIYINKIIQL